MNKFTITGLVIALSIFTFSVSAQPNKCATIKNLEKSFAKDATLKPRMQITEQATQEWLLNNSKAPRAGGQVVTIPVVVHVIWNDPSENVSTAQIQSQLKVINDDFRMLNADTLDDQHPFYNFTIDAKIEFCLAQQDPNGNPTTGITRTQTTVVTWDDNILDDIKSTANGGHDNWDPTKYLNLYVVNLDGTTLGFASFPDELATSPNMDGIVIRFEAFGTEGTAGTGTFTENGGGRTATHEVGHWLNLSHIWADTICGDDFVADTEPSEDANYECPNFPHRPNNTCGSGAEGEMYMNYMDYADDNCMNMFTVGQADRMSAALNGLRSGLLTSQGCELPNSINDNYLETAISVFPNPNNGIFSIQTEIIGTNNISASVVNILGSAIKNLGNLSNKTQSFDLSDLLSGVYYLKISSENRTVTRKIFITK